jgi:hypothetical protein
MTLRIPADEFAATNAGNTLLPIAPNRAEEMTSYE